MGTGIGARQLAGALLLAAAVTACSTSSGSTTDGLTVHTTGGTLHGVADGQVNRFNGIPYAAPPVGNLRWAAPRPARPWSGVRDAAKPGPRCPQTASDPGAVPSTNEDCLYLNVTTPSKPQGKRPPVMVWVHGGSGSGAGADYDPARLVEQGDVDVVTLNRRLGVFGNFADPQLGGAGGDFGVQDVQAALRWVRNNAAAFGGDPGNVTLFGESSGAFTTCSVLASPASAGLLDRAIMESSSCSAYFPKNTVAPGLNRYSLLAPLSDVAPAGTAMAATFGCDKQADQLACLRQVPAKSLLDKGFNDAFGQIAYNTNVIPESPATALRTGHLLPVPMMFGTNRDEMNVYIGAAMAAGAPFDAATV